MRFGPMKYFLQIHCLGVLHQFVNFYVFIGCNLQFWVLQIHQMMIGISLHALHHLQQLLQILAINCKIFLQNRPIISESLTRQISSMKCKSIKLYFQISTFLIRILSGDILSPVSDHWLDHSETFSNCRLKTRLIYLPCAKARWGCPNKSLL